MEKENIETILPLLPVQQAFLWHYLEKSDHGGLLHLRCTLEGSLNLSKLKAAWAEVSCRHQALRGSVHWENLKSPIQVIVKEQELSFSTYDIREKTDQTGWIRDFQKRDLALSIDLTKTPAFRISLFHTADNEYELIWTVHHLLIDGWSCALVLNDVIQHYESEGTSDNRNCSEPSSLQAYVRWIRQQPSDPSIRYWTEYLKTISRTTPLPYCRQSTDALKNSSANSSTDKESIQLEVGQTLAVKDLCRRIGITINAFLQSVWGLMLHQYSGDSTVVFGTTSSGRQADFPGIEKVVGMLINVLPVVIKIDPNASLQEWLHQTHERSFQMVPHSHFSLSDIQSNIDHPGRLFDSMLVVENQPTIQSGNTVSVKNAHSGLVSNYNLTVVAVPSESMAIHFQYKRSLFDKNDIGELANYFVQIIAGVLSNAGALSDLSISALQRNHPTSLNQAAPSIVRDAGDSKVSNEPVGDVFGTQLEHDLIRIWKRVLGTNTISVNDSFFDLGGNSLQAVSIFSELNKIINIKVPATSLFKTPTIAELANAIRQSDQLAAWSLVVEIQPNGTKPPLFIPDNITDLLLYKDLSDQLGPDQPIFGFRTKDVNNVSSDELAQELVTHVRAIQPDGPYMLAGLSSGGPLAWKMTQYLNNQNQEVALLALFDSIGPQYPRLRHPIPRLLSFTKFCFIERFKKVLGMNLGTFTSAVAAQGSRVLQSGPVGHHRFRSTKTQLQELLDEPGLLAKPVNLIIFGLLKLPISSRNLEMSYLCLQQGVWLSKRKSNKSTAADNESGRIYADIYGNLQPYCGNVLFFRASEKLPGAINDPMVGWGDHIKGEIKFFEVPGNHTTILQEPNVAILANALKLELEICAQADNPRTSD